MPANLGVSVMAGVGAGLLMLYGTPWVSGMFNLPSVGLIGRAVQAGVGLAGVWALRNFRVVAPSTAAAMTTVIVAIPVIGIVQDFMRGGLALPAGAAPSGESLSGVGYYDTSAYPAYGGAMPGMGYYDAVA